MKKIPYSKYTPGSHKRKTYEMARRSDILTPYLVIPAYISFLICKLLKGLIFTCSLFWHFRHLTVSDFMKTVASTSHEAGKVMPPITCKANSTLGDVVHSLASKLVHRIYVVDGEEDEVIGVITLRDVISCFIYEPPNYFDDYLGFSAEELLKR